MNIIFCKFLYESTNSNKVARCLRNQQKQIIATYGNTEFHQFRDLYASFNPPDSEFLRKAQYGILQFVFRSL